MNREIKFRAWDSQNKHMFYHDEDGEFERRIDGDRIGSDFTVNDLLFSCFDGIVCTQFTGLKDKNGIEIYEGDICQTGISKTKGLVSFIYGSFSWGNRAHKSCLCHIDLNEVEVIGNIYENPELLP